MTTKLLIVSISALLAFVVTLITIVCNWNDKKERCRRISGIALSFVGISIIAIFKNLTNTSKSETNADNQKE